MSAPRSVRSRKIENGSSGWRSRRSITTNAASRMTEPASLSRVPVEAPADVDGVDHRVHEQREARRYGHGARDVKPFCAIFRMLSSNNRGRPSPRRYRSYVHEQHPPPAQTARQNAASRTPAAPPAPATAPHMPSARLRSAPSANVVVMIDRAAGRDDCRAETLDRRARRSATAQTGPVRRRARRARRRQGRS